MKRILLSTVFILMLPLTLIWSSCTSNQNARKFGGTKTITLDPGVRVVNVTWKDNDMWILTKHDTTKPQTYTFKEKSNFGLMEGTVIIEEK